MSRLRLTAAFTGVSVVLSSGLLSGLALETATASSSHTSVSSSHSSTAKKPVKKPAKKVTKKAPSKKSTAKKSTTKKAVSKTSTTKTSTTKTTAPKTPAKPLGVSISCTAYSQPVYQRVNPATGMQLITANQVEIDKAGSSYGYSQDLKTAFRASGSGTGNVAVHRMVRTSPLDSIWAADPAEIASLLKTGYADRGGNFLASLNPASCLVPVYEMAKSGQHRQSADTTVIAGLKKAGWSQGRVSFYAAPATTASTPSKPTTPVPPTSAPTSAAPTSAPTSAAPTAAPSSVAPTAAPSSVAPTAAPSSVAPTAAPSSVAPVSGALPTGPLDLDRTGTTTPDTDYAIPAGATFIAPDGNDANPGTQAAPVRTLNRALTMTPAGGTVVFRGGVYRDSYNTSTTQAYTVDGKGVTLQAYPHEHPWLDGSDLVPGSQWTSDGAGHWYTSWNTPDFCGGKYYNVAPNVAGTACTWPDMIHGTALNPIPADPQQAFVDGVKQHQTDALSKVDGSDFYYDWNAKRLYIGVDPNAHTVELSKRTIAVVLGGRSHNTIKGLGFRRYASSPNEGINGAVYFGGWATVQDSVFTQMSGYGVQFALGTAPSSVTHSVFVDNGFDAVGANGTSQVSGAANDDFVLADNVFIHNNWEDTGVGCTSSCGQAAVKFSHVRGYTWRNNYVSQTGGGAAGLWCDLNCSQGQVIGNVVTDQPTSVGIFIEVSNTTLVADNLVSNVKTGIMIASANTKVYNNTIVNVSQGIRVYDDARSPGVYSYGKVWNDVGPDTTNVQVVNNLVYSTGWSLVALPQVAGSQAPNTGAESFFSAIDHNAFFQVNGGTPTFVLMRTLAGKDSGYTSSAAMAQATGFETHGLWAAGANPFVNSSTGDYRLVSTYASQLAAQALPSDVASALGVGADSVLALGASVTSAA